MLAGQRRRASCVSPVYPAGMISSLLIAMTCGHSTPDCERRACFSGSGGVGLSHPTDLWPWCPRSRAPSRRSTGWTTAWASWSRTPHSSSCKSHAERGNNSVGCICVWVYIVYIWFGGCCVEAPEVPAVYPTLADVVPSYHHMIPFHRSALYVWVPLQSSTVFGLWSHRVILAHRTEPEAVRRRELVSGLKKQMVRQARAD
jgi:hypothetical protein